MRGLLVLLVLIGACVENRGPAIGGAPFLDTVYSCRYEQRGQVLVAQLCWDGGASDLAEALVEFHPDVTTARCAPSPVAACLYTCEQTRAPSCNADHGCFCVQ